MEKFLLERNFDNISANGKRLCDVAPKNFLFFYFNQNYKIFWQVLLKTFRAILQNRCCVMCLFDFPCFLVIFWDFFRSFLNFQTKIYLKSKIFKIRLLKFCENLAGIFLSALFLFTKFVKFSAKNFCQRYFLSVSFFGVIFFSQR